MLLLALLMGKTALFLFGLYYILLKIQILIGMEALQKTKIEVLDDPAIPLLHKYPKEPKSTHPRDVYAVIPTIAKRANQSYWTPTNEWAREV